MPTSEITGFIYTVSEKNNHGGKCDNSFVANFLLGQTAENNENRRPFGKL